MGVAGGGREGGLDLKLQGPTPTRHVCVRLGVEARAGSRLALSGVPRARGALGGRQDAGATAGGGRGGAAAALPAGAPAARID